MGTSAALLPESSYWVVVGNVGADGLDGQPVNKPNRFHGVPIMLRQPGAPYTGVDFIPPTYDPNRFHVAQVQHRADAYSWEIGPFLVDNVTGKIFVGHIDPATLTYSYFPLNDPTAEVVDTSTWVYDPYTDNNSGHLVDPNKIPFDAAQQYLLAYGPNGGPLNPQDPGYGKGYYGYTPAPLLPTSYGDAPPNLPVDSYAQSARIPTLITSGFDNGDAPPNLPVQTIATETSAQSGPAPANSKWLTLAALAGGALLLLSSRRS